MKDVADAALTVAATGGKKGFISNVVGHKGLPAGTRARARDTTASLSVSPHVVAEGGHYSLPHPFKTETGVAHNRR